jgi:DNA-binding transcriptional LysR family regulator
MTELMDWTLVRSFLAVVRQGSLSAAARTTGLTQPTIGRHIEQLEKNLGLALFSRSNSGLIPTEAATGLILHAEAMEIALAALVRASKSGGDDISPEGTVRITASEIMGLNVIPSILKTLRFAYPKIFFELALNNRTDNLLRRAADIAVRMVRPKQDGLVARKIGDVFLKFYAHRSYVEQFGAPKTMEELKRFHLIGFDQDDHSARSVVAGSFPVSRDMFSLRCDSDSVQLAALKSGLGIGLVQLAIARTDANLIEILPNAAPLKLECWLAVHEDQKNQPAIRATLDGLTEGLSRWVASQHGGS